jgi:hypothetical protein
VAYPFDHFISINPSWQASKKPRRVSGCIIKPLRIIRLVVAIYNHFSLYGQQGILEMSRDRQELRGTRHHPEFERSKAAKGEIAKPDRLKTVTLLLTGLLIMVVSSGCTENSTLAAKINRAYGTSFAVGAQPVEPSAAAN